jgi:hypothetical protein
MNVDIQSVKSVKIDDVAYYPSTENFDRFYTIKIHVANKWNDCKDSITLFADDPSKFAPLIAPSIISDVIEALSRIDENDCDPDSYDAIQTSIEDLESIYDKYGVES